MSGNDLLALHNMSVHYGSVKAVSNVTLSLAPGQVIALLGPNGAGKSSILKGIAGTARTHGGIQMEGHDISMRAPHRRVRDGITTVPQGRRIFPDMSVAENLLVSLRGERRSRLPNMQRVWEQFPRLQERADTRAGLLSGGEQQMLALGRAMIAGPRVLLLDEPSLGLSPKMVKIVFSKLREFVEARVSMIVVDQNATQAMSLADHVCVVSRGTMVYSQPSCRASEELDVVQAHLGIDE